MQKYIPPKRTLVDVITCHAKWRSNKLALICGEKQLSWKEFNLRINKVANSLLALGFKKGDKASVLMSNSSEMLEVIFGIIKAGGVIVPLSTMVLGEVLCAMIEDSGSRVIFVDSQLQELINPIKYRLDNVLDIGFISIGFDENGWHSYKHWIDDALGNEPHISLGFEDDFSIIYTSGTTGVPKGIVYTHFARYIGALITAVEFGMNSRSISLVTTPLYANASWLMLLPTFSVGGTLTIMQRFDPVTFLELIQSEKCTHTFMVPIQFIRVMEAAEFDMYDKSSLKTMVSGAANLRKETKAKIMRLFPGDLVEIYGVTEGFSTILKPEDMEEKIDAVGKPTSAGDLRLINEDGQEVPPDEEGEIVGINEALFKGYHNQPDKTREAIWHDEYGQAYVRTGDLGKLDKDGFLHILDRKKDVIISGGMNIYANDIEDVLAAHDEVDDTAVIGIPDKKWGETPLALVVRKRNSSISEDDLKEWLNLRLAKYQRVSILEFRKSLPRSPIGKVLKRMLREPYWKKHGV